MPEGSLGTIEATGMNCCRCPDDSNLWMMRTLCGNTTASQSKGKSEPHVGLAPKTQLGAQLPGHVPSPAPLLPKEQWVDILPTARARPTAPTRPGIPGPPVLRGRARPLQAGLPGALTRARASSSLKKTSLEPNVQGLCAGRPGPGPAGCTRAASPGRRLSGRPGQRSALCSPAGTLGAVPSPTSWPRA